MSKHRTIFGLIKHSQICLNRMIGVTHIIMDNRNSRTGRESVGIQKESRQLTLGQGTSHQGLKTNTQNTQEINPFRFKLKSQETEREQPFLPLTIYLFPFYKQKISSSRDEHMLTVRCN